ncbi:MAG: hypothetical protein ABL949_09835 [Fimbriimonadaceae bacterium]
MKRVVCILLATLSLSAAFAAQERRPIRIQIRHADPYFVKGMMEGRGLTSPELSTALDFMGLPGQIGNVIDSIFKDGTFLVNAGDNSLWWIPNSKGR